MNSLIFIRVICEAITGFGEKSCVIRCCCDGYEGELALVDKNGVSLIVDEAANKK